MTTYTLGFLIKQFGGQLVGADKEITGIASLLSAGPDQISFLSSAKYRRQVEESHAGALIVTPKIAETLSDRNLIITDDPYLYFARVARLFSPEYIPVPGIHASVVIGADSVVPESCEIAANVVIGCNVILGECCHIEAGVIIGDNVTVGLGTTLFANVVLYEGATIGEGCRIHAGVVIGSDGFGLAWDKENNNWFKIPQTGIVRIGNNVEIGANTTIDRGALDDTIIEDNAKIDNLVQIGHNCRIGKATAVAGCVGIAGSTDIGANCLIGGAVMFSGHIEIEDGTMIGGGTAVAKSLTKDHYASFFPLMKHKEWVKNAAQLRHLSEMSAKMKQLEEQITQLTQKLEQN